VKPSYQDELLRFREWADPIDGVIFGKWVGANDDMRRRLDRANEAKTACRRPTRLFSLARRRHLGGINGPTTTASAGSERTAPTRNTVRLIGYDELQRTQQIKIIIGQGIGSANGARRIIRGSPQALLTHSKFCRLPSAIPALYIF
jgi:hypothetical protein